MTTISDIARRAGVGVGTVSRVLNRSESVSEATRRRVLDVIEELEYTPSSVARGLSLGRTSTVAAAIPFVTHASAVERLRGVVAALRESAYDLVVFDVEDPQQRDDRLRTIARGDRADGAIVISLHPSDEDVARLERSGVTTVLVGDGRRHDRRRGRLLRGIPRVVAARVADASRSARTGAGLEATSFACLVAARTCERAGASPPLLAEVS